VTLFGGASSSRSLLYSWSIGRATAETLARSRNVDAVHGKRSRCTCGSIASIGSHPVGAFAWRALFVDSPYDGGNVGNHQMHMGTSNGDGMADTCRQVALVLLAKLLKVELQRR
jgi:hypothetical protein